MTIDEERNAARSEGYRELYRKRAAAEALYRNYKGRSEGWSRFMERRDAMDPAVAKYRR